MSEEKNTEVKEEPKAILFSEFLESIPPSNLMSISDLSVTKNRGSTYAYYELLTPDIQLHCPDDACNGTRFFRCTSSEPSVPDDEFKFFYISYRCSNCQKTTKTFSLAAQNDKNANSGRCYKFGELPVYGPPTPSRLIKLIGPDREIFLKGRRCENQGLGGGVFIY